MAQSYGCKSHWIISNCCCFLVRRVALTFFLICVQVDAVVKATMDYDLRNVERLGNDEEVHTFLSSFKYCFDRIGTKMKGEEAAEFEIQKQKLEGVINMIV